MTVKHLHQHIMIINRKNANQENGVDKHKLIDLILPGHERATIDVDIYNSICQAVRSREGTHSYHTIPNIRNEAALARFKEKHRCVSGNDIDPIFVFDGAQKVLKEATNTDHSSKLVVAQQQL
jgi:hypothetical protein